MINASTATPLPGGRTQQRRMVFIDVARSAAILAALAAHAVAVFAVWPAVPPGLFKAAGNAIFFTATPTFFLLFGVMLELVYVRRRERDGALPVASRLAVRAWQCWLGLVLGMVCAWWSGRLTGAQLPDALLNLIDTPNSGILRFYTAALLLCIPVVLLRPRLGPALPLVLVGVIWIGAALLPLLPWPVAGSRWGFLCGFLVAVWHSVITCARARFKDSSRSAAGRCCCWLPFASPVLPSAPLSLVRTHWPRGISAPVGPCAAFAIPPIFLSPRCVPWRSSLWRSAVIR